MSIRLGLDASQVVASCAISNDMGIITAATIEKPIEYFPALIRDVVTRANINLRDVDEIVVCIGPGSQTGIRSAVVTGNALALALNKPISGILSTDAAAALLKSNDTYSVAVSAGRRRYFMANYYWNREMLCREDAIELVDEIPHNTHSLFTQGIVDLNVFESCACGSLIIAAHQRQLIAQSMLSEVLPYERRDLDGR